MDSALKNVCFMDLPVNVHTVHGLTYSQWNEKKRELPINSFNHSSQFSSGYRWKMKSSCLNQQWVGFEKEKEEQKPWGLQPHSALNLFTQ